MPARVGQGQRDRLGGDRAPLSLGLDGSAELDTARLEREFTVLLPAASVIRRRPDPSRIVELLPRDHDVAPQRRPIPADVPGPEQRLVDAAQPLAGGDPDRLCAAEGGLTEVVLGRVVPAVVGEAADEFDVPGSRRHVRERVAAVSIGRGQIDSIALRVEQPHGQTAERRATLGRGHGAADIRARAEGAVDAARGRARRVDEKVAG